MPHRRPAPTSDAIVEAAVRCFLRDGYEAVQMRTVAAEAGTSVGQLYLQFPSKSALLVAVSAWGNRHLMEQYLVPAAFSTDVAFDRALAVAEAYFDFYVQERELAKLLSTVSLAEALAEGDSSAQQLAEVQRGQYDRMQEIMADLGLDPRYEPARVMRWCWAALYGLLALNVRLPHLAVDDEELDQIIGTGMRMLRLTVRDGAPAGA